MNGRGQTGILARSASLSSHCNPLHYISRKKFRWRHKAGYNHLIFGTLRWTNHHNALDVLSRLWACHSEVFIFALVQLASRFLIIVICRDIRLACEARVISISLNKRQRYHEDSRERKTPRTLPNLPHDRLQADQSITKHSKVHQDARPTDDMVRSGLSYPASSLSFESLTSLRCFRKNIFLASTRSVIFTTPPYTWFFRVSYALPSPASLLHWINSSYIEYDNFNLWEVS